jgi:multiple sugar transport system permease protein
MFKSTFLKQVHLHALIVLFGLIMIYPLLWMLISSFKPELTIFNGKFWPETFTLQNYLIGWAGVSKITFATFYKNTLFIVAVTIIGNLLTCSMAAYAFARIDFSFKKTLFAIMMITMMLPSHVVLIPQYIIFNKLGWVNTYLPLLVPKFLASEAFFIFLMIQFIRGIPRELDQSARVDGCGPIQTYWRIILPLATPALVTTVIFSFIWTWNDFFSQLLYLNNIRIYTISLGLRLFLDSQGESAFGALFAMSSLSLVPVFIIFIFFQKYLIDGITAGSVKG